MTISESITFRDELCDANLVDQRNRTPGPFWKAKAKDRTDVRFARIGDDALLHALSGFQRHAIQNALLELGLHFIAERIDHDGDRQFGQTRPKGLDLTVIRVIVKALAIAPSVSA